MLAIGTDNLLAFVIVMGPPLLMSLTIHEFSHARMALAFGDPTAKLMGRVSLNPLRHLDLFGTIAIFIVHFGWAKPVPVNPANLHPRKLGNIAVSLAGPMSNLLIATLCGLVLRAESTWQLGAQYGLLVEAAPILRLTMKINLALCIFNLIPLFPLDGHHVLRELLPPTKQRNFMLWQMGPGRLMLMVIIFLPMILGRPGPLTFMFQAVIDPAIEWVSPQVVAATG